MRSSGSNPNPADIEDARANVGMHLVELDERDVSVRFQKPGVMLDLGAIGKGYALERAAEILTECGVRNVLLHGGTSTVKTIGAPPGLPGWRIAIEHPDSSVAAVSVTNRESIQRKGNIIATHTLRDESLSVSAVWGKSFTESGRTFGHVIDPRTGFPVADAVLAAVVTSSATEADALSTALLTLGPSHHDQLAVIRPGIKTVLITSDAHGGEDRVIRRGG